jgi:hypothetical protein
VFAGGDPSLRGDVPEVVAEALALGLAVQVQTNAQHVSRPFLGVLGHIGPKGRPSPGLRKLGPCPANEPGQAG